MGPQTIDKARDAWALEQIKATVWRRACGIYRWGTTEEKEILSKILDKEGNFELKTLSEIDEGSTDIHVMYIKVMNRKNGMTNEK